MRRRQRAPSPATRALRQRTLETAFQSRGAAPQTGVIEVDGDDDRGGEEDRVEGHDAPMERTTDSGPVGVEDRTLTVGAEGPG
eukprot:8395625-Alexandrium_andersonii.AAC.1